MGLSGTLPSGHQRCSTASVFCAVLSVVVGLTTVGKWQAALSRAGWLALPCAVAPGMLADRAVSWCSWLCISGVLESVPAHWWVGSCPRVMSLCPKVAGYGVRE